MRERRPLTLAVVRALMPGEVAWDSRLPGFGVRRQKGAAVTFVVIYRTREGRQRWHSLGRFGVLTPDTARAAARQVLAEVVAGADPAADKSRGRRAETVAELCEAFLADADSGRLLKRNGEARKPSAVAIDRGRVAHHIRPLLGKLKVASVTRQDVEDFLHSVAEGKTGGRVKTAKRSALVRGGKGAATRCVGLLGRIFSYAIERGLRPDNPVSRVRVFATQHRTRRLAPSEYAQLSAGIATAVQEGAWPPALAVARLLAVTGWRAGEALKLTWAEIDFERRTAMLRDTKTGASMRPLSESALAILRGMQPHAGLARDDGLVFPAPRAKGRIDGFAWFWKRIREASGLPADVSPHVLRHSFASVAADLGLSDSTIGALIGHKQQTMTSRYVHRADSVLLAAADSVATSIVAMMNGETAQ